ncbi:hypothetical protein [Peribacillus frigoritolerans]|uniref:Uncharacterized protein n=1 Tax=Peribacillus castrilensis TaxID=2897690 RepID=A0AAW9NEE4_9BACI|nr:hypothetical protein [Peribacillus castrilensis]
MKNYAILLPNNWLAETSQALALRRLGRKSAEKGADFWNRLKSNLRKNRSIGSSRTKFKTR